MTPTAIIEQAAADGVNLTLSPAGTIKATGNSDAVNRWAARIREHKPAIVAALQESANDTAADAGVEQFEFSPPSDPANDAEALEERAAIIAEGCGIDQARALQEARWQADRERCWRVFMGNAERILNVPAARRETMLADYRARAAQRYGEATARDMAGTLRNWVNGRGVH